MRVYDFLLSIATQMGDNHPSKPFRRYALSDLVTYYGEAMCFVASHRPDLFTDMMVMKLSAGSYQDARCCGCKNVIGIVSQIDANGATVKDLSSSGSSPTKTSRWYRAPCQVTTNADGTTTTNTTITSTSIEAGMNGVFTVDPPVPVGKDVWVKLKCVGSPPTPSLSDVISTATTGNCSFLPAIRNYIRYLLLGGDRLAQGATQEAQYELKNAYTYLGVQIKYENLQEAE